MDSKLREVLGEEVRLIWIEWARQQPSPKPSWLVPWAELSEPDKEVDRRIGVRLFLMGEAFALTSGQRQTSELREEIAALKEPDRSVYR